jgi:hypothetical protein
MQAQDGFGAGQLQHPKELFDIIELCGRGWHTKGSSEIRDGFDRSVWDQIDKRVYIRPLIGNNCASDQKRVCAIKALISRCVLVLTSFLHCVLRNATRLYGDSRSL